MLPKEKLFIEELFEKRLIDTVVGTDALALGVNFPVENVVFTQLAKYYDGPISKNLFEQLAGRAGRKGYFNEGSVYYCDDFEIEAQKYKTKELYEELLQKENESLKIKLNPNIGEILKGRTIEEEIDYILEYSTEAEWVEDNIERQLDDIKNGGINENEEEEKLEFKMIRDEYEEHIANVYFDEYSPFLNARIFRNILLGRTTQEIISNCYNSENLYDLLQLRKYTLALPKKYRQGIDLQEIEQRINEIDETALNENRGLISIKDISKGTKEEQIETEAITGVISAMQEQLYIKNKQQQEQVEV